jgi:hypothetical protein
VLAVTKLLSVADGNVKGTAPCGKAYSISDGTPVDNFEFFRPLCLARKAEFPSVTIPTFLALIIAFFCEIVYLFFSSIPPFLHIEPFMTRSEVHKVCVYFGHSWLLLYNFIFVSGWRDSLFLDC